MSFELSYQYLRSIKHLLCDSNKTKHYHGKCPFCKSIIEIAEVFTSQTKVMNNFIVPELNEKGIMIGKCHNYNCRYYFKLEVFNPDLSCFNSGATKKDNYIYVDNETKKIDEYEFVKSMEEIIDTNNIFKNRNDNYNFDNHPLYICNTCERNLEPIAYSDLEIKWHTISKKYYNYINWSLGKGGCSPKNIVINFPINCPCGDQHIAKFVSSYHENPYFDNHEFSLLDIYGSKPLTEHVFAVHSKTTVMNWLYKLIARWNFLFDKIYLISPFVSYQFAKKDQRVDTWLEIINRTDPLKTLISTKGKEVNSFKNAYSEINEISYKELESYGLGSNLVESVKKNNKFHAKVYCGISNGVCEVLSGSVNITEGPTPEVINFNRIFDSKKAYDIFLKPLGIDDISNELNTLNTRDYSLFFDEKRDFSPIEFYKEDYIDYVINNIIPKPLVI